MSLDTDQTRSLVRSILKDLPHPHSSSDNLWSQSAENLVLGTIAVESGFGEYIKSADGKGLANIEEPAFYDHFDFMETADNGWGLIYETICMNWLSGQSLSWKELEWNNALSIALCRVHYCRIKKNLPPADNVNALGSYYVFHYRSCQEHIPAHIAKFKNNYHKHILSA